MLLTLIFHSTKSVNSLHAFACFGKKLLCRHSTLMAKVNFCIKLNFWTTVIKLFLSKNYRKTEIAILCTEVNVAKYVNCSRYIAISLRKPIRDSLRH